MTEHFEPRAADPRPEQPRTGAHIIRRTPTGAVPVASDASGAGGRDPMSSGPAAAPLPPVNGSAAVPIAACAVAIVSGWATSVVATDLVASWWRSDRLFCVAVGFLTLVFAGTTISGVILLLLRRSAGGYLITIGAVVGMLTFGSLFIAGARVPWVVHGVPVIQAASAALALHPATRRWLSPG